MVSKCGLLNIILASSGAFWQTQGFQEKLVKAAKA